MLLQKLDFYKIVCNILFLIFLIKFINFYDSWFSLNLSVIQLKTSIFSSAQIAKGYKKAMKFVHSLDQHGPVSVQNRMAGYIWCQNTQEPQNGLDLTFICSNGSVSAHKLVVQECSPIISTIINQDGLLEEEHTKILLPEIKVGLVRKCLQLIYTGLAFFNSDTELKESLKFCIEQLNMNFVVDKHTLDAVEQQQHQHQQPPPSPPPHPHT